MMDRRSLYDGLNQLEQEMNKNLEDLVSMKETLLDLVEKNATLEMENERLRERIREIDEKNSPVYRESKQK